MTPAVRNVWVIAGHMRAAAPCPGHGVRMSILRIDTAHCLVGSGTTREALSVAATRGRRANTLNVTLDDDNDLAASHEAQPDTAEQILARTLATSGTDTSAHTALRSHPDDSPEPRFPPATGTPAVTEPPIGPSF